FGIAPDFLRPDPPRVYVSENGGDTEDELDLSRGGLNYGWPAVEGTVGATPEDGFEDPLRVWNPIAAPTGIVQYRGPIYPEAYRGGLFVNLYVGRLVTDGVLNGRVWTDFVRLNAAGDAVAETEAFIVFNTLGASAPVALVEGPDGVLYLATESTIYRVHFPLGEAMYDVTPPGYPAPYDVGDAVLWLMVQSGLVS
ncbi:MAG: PQQ-dependent sugar dehydrogenase, partial [Candidatus Methylomirabilis sp.]|nr:PQQ-dependent sugar dehydrogenase [Deltaproteobacteria bacterium]